MYQAAVTLVNGDTTCQVKILDKNAIERCIISGFKRALSGKVQYTHQYKTETPEHTEAVTIITNGKSITKQVLSTTIHSVKEGLQYNLDDIDIKLYTDVNGFRMAKVTMGSGRTFKASLNRTNRFIVQWGAYINQAYLDCWSKVLAGDVDTSYGGDTGRTFTDTIRRFVGYFGYVAAESIRKASKETTRSNRHHTVDSTSLDEVSYSDEESTQVLSSLIHDTWNELDNMELSYAIEQLMDEKEFKVLALLQEGYGAREIVAMLHINPRIITRVQDKLKVILTNIDTNPIFYTNKKLVVVLNTPKRVGDTLLNVDGETVTLYQLALKDEKTAVNVEKILKVQHTVRQ
jgi:hypothetical protein